MPYNQSGGAATPPTSRSSGLCATPSPDSEGTNQISRVVMPQAALIRGRRAVGRLSGQM